MCYAKRMSEAIRRLERSAIGLSPLFIALIVAASILTLVNETIGSSFRSDILSILVGLAIAIISLIVGRLWEIAVVYEPSHRANREQEIEDAREIAKTGITAALRHLSILNEAVKVEIELLEHAKTTRKNIPPGITGWSSVGPSGIATKTPQGFFQTKEP
jgi:hypothetical protein